MVEKNPVIEFSPLDSSDKWCVNWRYWRGAPFDVLKLKEIASNFSLFLIRFAFLRRILDAVMKDETRARVGSNAKQKEEEPVTDEEESQLWQSGVFGMETAKSLLNVVYYYDGKLFGLRGGQKRRICLKNFEVGDNYIRFEENASKTFHGGVLDLKYEPRAVTYICHSTGEHHEPVLLNITAFILLLCKFARRKLLHSISGVTQKECALTNYLWA